MQTPRIQIDLRMTLFSLSRALMFVGVFYESNEYVSGSKRLYPVSILYKSIAGRYRPVSYPDGPITARYRFVKNASWFSEAVRMRWLIWAFVIQILSHDTRI